MTDFQELGLNPRILSALEALDYSTPTPIQSGAIPLVLEGHDVMGLAQTGTGKTAAFGLPLVQKLMEGHEKPAPKHIHALILAPTRELVNQIGVSLRAFVRKTPLKIGSVVGGASINVQIKNLQRGTDILVATPGRLLDLIERGALSLADARFLVLDEADQMLDLGFIHDLRKISRLVARPRQTLLFSATMPKQIEELSRSYQTDPVRIEVAPPGKAADKIRQCVHFVDQRGKTDLLHDCLIQRRDDLSLVFARTKHGAEKLMKQLVAAEFKASSIHGNKSQGQRERAIKGFRDGEIRVLVATDVAARGIDIPGVSHVYNFDLPEVAENYVHRIGRTARAGAEGEAVAFCAAHELHLLRDIEKLMSIKIRVASGEEPDRQTANAARTEKGQAANNRRRGGRAAAGRNSVGRRRPEGKKPGAADGAKKPASAKKNSRPKNRRGGQPAGNTSKPSTTRNRAGGKPGARTNNRGRGKPRG